MGLQKHVSVMDSKSLVTDNWAREGYLTEAGWANQILLRKGLAAAAAKSLQSCPTLRDPIESSTPGSPVPGILQARTLEWVAISFSNA